MNRYRPHVFVVPEDDANRQLAIGFVLGLPSSWRIQVLSPAGGWLEVLRSFERDHIDLMDRYPDSFLVMLIDFDASSERLPDAKARIPPHLAHRVLILGTWTEPEDLKPELGDYETIGQALARDCREGTNATWAHNLLRHNESEIQRAGDRMRSILFEST